MRWSRYPCTGSSRRAPSRSRSGRRSRSRARTPARPRRPGLRRHDGLLALADPAGEGGELGRARIRTSTNGRGRARRTPRRAGGRLSDPPERQVVQDSLARRTPSRRAGVGEDALAPQRQRGERHPGRPVPPRPGSRLHGPSSEAVEQLRAISRRRLRPPRSGTLRAPEHRVEELEPDADQACEHRVHVGTRDEVTRRSRPAIS